MQKFYSISEFAKKSTISTRMLRYYDTKGLLTPSYRNKLGYRMYTNKDLVRLQYILALKFLGFSLTEIKFYINNSSDELKEVLSQQRMMMKDKIVQIETVICAIDETEKLLQENQNDYQAIVEVIKSVQMELKPAWMSKYLSSDEREYMRELAQKSYDRETIQKLSERGWTEEDQRNSHNRYMYFRGELKRLTDQGVKPESLEAQALGQLLYDINNDYIRGDPKIREGMKRSWENFKAVPDERKPKIYQIPDEENEYIKKVMMIFYKNRS